jgi:hypothetical protein
MRSLAKSPQAFHARSAEAPDSTQKQAAISQYPAPRTGSKRIRNKLDDDEGSGLE